MGNNETEKNSNEPKKKSWLERNIWWVATGLAIFLMRMCSELS